MKKRDGKVKMNNKGFSLVELIVVIAIMAVLIGVLAPQYLRYVEKARLQKDNSAIAEIANAIKIAMADETINTYVGAGNNKIESTSAADSAKVITFTSGADVLSAEMYLTIGGEWTSTSNTYQKSSTPITFEIKNDGGVVTVSVSGYYTDPKLGATTEVF